MSATVIISLVLRAATILGGLLLAVRLKSNVARLVIGLMILLIIRSLIRLCAPLDPEGLGRVQEWLAGGPGTLLATVVLVTAMSIAGRMLLAGQNSMTEVAKSERRFRSMIENSPEGIALLGEDGEVRYRSANVYSLLGYRAGEGTPLRPLEGVHPDDRALVQEQFVECAAGRGPAQREMQIRFRHAQGHYVWVECTFQNRLNDPDVQSIVVNWRDVSERRQMEQSLGDSLHLLRSVIEGIDDPIYFKDEAGRYQLLNSATAQFMDRPVEECLGKTDVELLGAPTGERFMADDRELRQSRESRRFEEAFSWQNQDLHFLTTKTPLLDSQGRALGIIGISRNVTEQKRLEERMQFQEHQLAHVARLSTMGEMTAVLSHEINQPLFAIQNFATACGRLLEQDNLSDLERLRRWNRSIAEEAERAGAIIARLRDFAARRAIDAAQLDLHAVIREAVELLAPQARSKRVQVELHLADAAPLVEFDRIQLQQVFVNLLLNAFEAVSGPGAVAPRVEIATQLHDQEVVVIIADWGVGLDEEITEHCFEPFMTTKPEGLGLGLSISRSLVQAAGGKLWVEPHAPGGARFCFSLPLVRETVEGAA